MSKRLAFWLTFLSLALAVGAGGVWARDVLGTPRPCAQCRKSVRTPVGVEVPLHEGCRARYADAQIENQTFTFEVTREQVMGDQTKLQVTDSGATVSGVLGVYSQTVYPILISAPTHYVYAVIGGVGFIIQDISTDGWAGPDPQPSPPGGTQLTFAVFICHNAALAMAHPPAQSDAIEHEFVYMTDASDDDLERSFSMSVTGQRLWREESTSYGAGRDGKPVFADDVDYSDAWVAERPASWTATFGSWSYSGTQTEDPFYGWVPDVNPINNVQLYFEQHKGQDWLKYAAATGLQWSAVNMDFSGMSKTYGSAPPSVGGKVTGSLGGLELTYNDTAQRTSSWSHGLPLIADLHPNVWDRDGNLVENARLALPIQASWEVPASFDWSTTP